MAVSRISRVEERKQQRRLIFAIAGSVAVVAFILFFGLKILVGFSLFVDWIRGGSAPQANQQSVILPPVLNPLPEATFSASLKVSGSAQPDLTLLLFVNEREYKKLTIPSEGTFEIDDVALTEGENVISAKAADEAGTMSELSNVLRVKVSSDKPLLEVDEPQEGASVVSDTNAVVVVGRTEEDNSVTINGRYVVLEKSGSFRFSAQLSDGDNVLSVVATDPAGNQTTIDRRVSYRR